MSPYKDYYPDPESKHQHRYEICVKAFKRRQDLKPNRTRSGHHINKQFAPSTAVVSAVRYKKLVEQQDSLPEVIWGEKPTNNCWRFKYPDLLFDVDGG